MIDANEYYAKIKIAEYEAIKSRNRLIAIFFICLTIGICFYIYFGLPIEDKYVENDNGNIVVETTLDNGSQIWQTK